MLKRERKKFVVNVGAVMSILLWSRWVGGNAGLLVIASSSRDSLFCITSHSSKKGTTLPQEEQSPSQNYAAQSMSGNETTILKKRMYIYQTIFNDGIIIRCMQYRSDERFAHIHSVSLSLKLPQFTTLNRTGRFNFAVSRFLGERALLLIVRVRVLFIRVFSLPLHAWCLLLST